VTHFKGLVAVDPLQVLSAAEYWMSEIDRLREEEREKFCRSELRKSKRSLWPFPCLPLTYEQIYAQASELYRRRNGIVPAPPVPWETLHKDRLQHCKEMMALGKATFHSPEGHDFVYVGPEYAKLIQDWDNAENRRGEQ